MSVYVDNAKHRFGNMVMCHMIADTELELRKMASRIRVKEQWCQFPGSYRVHFDISQGKRILAIAAGAHPITRLELAAILRARREGLEASEKAKAAERDNRGGLPPGPDAEDALRDDAEPYRRDPEPGAA